jgi:hypothetical protein
MSLAEVEPTYEPLEGIALPDTGTGERHRRRQERARERRQLVKLQVVVVLVFVLALAVTLVVLGSQWLGSDGGSSGSHQVQQPAGGVP